MERRDSKLTSGRWVLTVISGIVFAYVAINKILPPEAVAGIIVMVFSNYFNRKRSKEE